MGANGCASKRRLWACVEALPGPCCKQATKIGVYRLTSSDASGHRRICRQRPDRSSRTMCGKGSLGHTVTRRVVCESFVPNLTRKAFLITRPLRVPLLCQPQRRNCAALRMKNLWWPALVQRTEELNCSTVANTRKLEARFRPNHPAGCGTSSNGDIARSCLASSGDTDHPPHARAFVAIIW